MSLCHMFVCMNCLIHCSCPSQGIFVKPTCSEQYIVVTTAVRCMCMRPRVCVCVRPSEFVQTITSTIFDGFQNNLTQFFST